MTKIQVYAAGIYHQPRRQYSMFIRIQ